MHSSYACDVRKFHVGALSITALALWARRLQGTLPGGCIALCKTAAALAWKSASTALQQDSQQLEVNTLSLVAHLLSKQICSLGTRADFQLLPGTSLAMRCNLDGNAMELDEGCRPRALA